MFLAESRSLARRSRSCRLSAFSTSERTCSALNSALERSSSSLSPPELRPAASRRSSRQASRPLSGSREIQGPPRINSFSPSSISLAIVTSSSRFRRGQEPISRRYFCGRSMTLGGASAWVATSSSVGTSTASRGGISPGRAFPRADVFDQSLDHEIVDHVIGEGIGGKRDVHRPDRQIVSRFPQGGVFSGLLVYQIFLHGCLSFPGSPDPCLGLEKLQYSQLLIRI